MNNQCDLQLLGSFTFPRVRLTVTYNPKLRLCASVEADVGAVRDSVGSVRLHVCLCA